MVSARKRVSVQTVMLRCSHNIENASTVSDPNEMLTYDIPMFRAVSFD